MYLCFATLSQILLKKFFGKKVFQILVTYGRSEYLMQLNVILHKSKIATNFRTVSYIWPPILRFSPRFNQIFHYINYDYKAWRLPVVN